MRKNRWKRGGSENTAQKQGCKQRKDTDRKEREKSVWGRTGVAEPEPGHFGRSRFDGPALA